MDTLKPCSRTVGRFLNDECGATAIEYAMIAAGIAVAIIGTVNTLGVSVKNIYETISSAMG